MPHVPLALDAGELLGGHKTPQAALALDQAGAFGRQLFSPGLRNELLVSSGGILFGTPVPGLHEGYGIAVPAEDKCEAAKRVHTYRVLARHRWEEHRADPTDDEKRTAYNVAAANYRLMLYRFKRLLYPGEDPVLALVPCLPGIWIDGKSVVRGPYSDIERRLAVENAKAFFEAIHACLPQSTSHECSSIADFVNHTMGDLAQGFFKWAICKGSRVTFDRDMFKASGDGSAAPTVLRELAESGQLQRLVNALNLLCRLGAPDWPAGWDWRQFRDRARNVARALGARSVNELMEYDMERKNEAYRYLHATLPDYNGDGDWVDEAGEPLTPWSEGAEPVRPRARSKDLVRCERCPVHVTMVHWLRTGSEKAPIVEIGTPYGGTLQGETGLRAEPELPACFEPDCDPACCPPCFVIYVPGQGVKTELCKADMAFYSYELPRRGCPDCCVLGFCWEAPNVPLNSDTDTEHADIASIALHLLIEDLCLKCPGATIHIWGVHLGARVVMGALTRMAASDSAPAWGCLGHVALAGPSIRHDAFDEDGEFRAGIDAFYRLTGKRKILVATDRTPQWPVDGVAPMSQVGTSHSGTTNVKVGASGSLSFEDLCEWLSQPVQ